ncbi:hypothetical protein BC830DRAFT_90111 [Chytriomyces sp. MP71]|nr:hypothetical protein BC830DRAFT_90111 [Chytriomyces sp. MP71]
MEDVLHSDTVYSPPTLRELAARVLHRRQCHVPRSLPGHLKAYMSPAGVRACSFCSGPMMECEVVRWRKVPRDGGVLVAREVLCWRHWDTEAQRIVAMFGRPGWTAPVVAPVGVGGVTVMRAKSGLSSGTTSPAGLGRRSRAGSMEVVGGSNTVAGGGGGGRSRTGSNNSLLLGSNYRWRRGTGDEIDEADVTISLSEESGREILPPPLVNRQAIAAAAAAAATKRKSQQDSAFNAGSSKKSGLRVAHSMMSFFA